MSQISCERCGFPVPMRWLHAGGDLAQPNGIRQRTDRPSIRSERPLKVFPHSPDLACGQTCNSHLANIAPSIEIGTNIKST